MAQSVDLNGMAKLAGLSEKDLSVPRAELIKLLAKKLKELEPTVEIEDAKGTIENAKKLDEIKKVFTKPFDIYVKSVGAKMTSTIVQVVGYVPEISSFVVYRNENFYKVTDDEIIKSTAELEKIKKQEKDDKIKKAAKTKAEKQAG